MRLLVMALLALGAVRMFARRAVRSADSSQVYWVVTVTVNPGKLEEFKQLIAEAVASTITEPKTLEYQWNLSQDQTTVDIVERYVDSAAVVAHVNGFKEKFGRRFMECVTPTRFAIYGPVSAEAMEALAPFNPMRMSAIDGFARE